MSIQKNPTARPQTARRNKRQGAVMTEFVIVAPMLFLFFFAAFEFCRVAMIRHTADNAVYEGTRVAIIPGATADDAITEATRILNSIGLSNTDIDVIPKKIKKDTEEVTVRISVPLDDNSFVPNQFVAGQTIVRELTMRREGVRSTADRDALLARP